MDLAAMNHTVSLLYRVFDSRHSTVPIIETPPQKPPFRRSPINQPFERATPESQNVSSERILSFIKELVSDKTLNMHNLMILRNGKVICETSFGAQDLRYWKYAFSACKSVTALAVGILVDNGKLRLDDRVVDFFPDDTSAIGRLKMKDLTVSDLLTMASTVKFNEAKCMTETDWVKSFLSSGTRGDIGKTFNYNSLNTYMLSAILRKASGEGLSEFLEKRLFRPLGITGVFWEKCPKGIEKGGWGFYIRPEDFAKLGQLVLSNGMWNGRQLVSADWIRRAASAHMQPPESYGDFNYGYQIWVGKKHDSFLFNGMFGQNVLGFRANGVLLVTNAGNDETFQQSNYFSVANRYFADLTDDCPDNATEAYRELKNYLKRLKDGAQAGHPHHWWLKLSSGKAPALPDECAVISRRAFTAKDARAESVGLLPVVLQVVQNNYTKGFRSFCFDIEDNCFFVEYRESDEVYRFAVGFDKAAVTELSFHGEPYVVGVRGRFSADEDGREVLILKIDFLETPCTRTVKLFYGGDNPELRQSEQPGKNFVMKYMATVKEEESEKHPLLASALAKLDADLLDYKVERTFEPSVALEEIAR